ncbi:Apc15p protein-domain-containing protein [Corynascus novoguineensis]|uniref:Apc15p protein-domain-containing protein n=1 Tax=Corynascus novoguineensis TaxID=1126955 RepID=A0AAN7D4S0_9PEZI|nr:Apc15p protein-domain-containing protein [Corynascus novoguineensis]
MFTTLPEFLPRDSHSLWYTSRRNPSSSLYGLDPPQSAADHGLASAATTTPAAAANAVANNPTQNVPAGPVNPAAAAAGAASAAAQVIERSALGRLQAEEQLMERRRAAVTNLGSTWLKPVGVSKTLFQMREEQREAEEHAEALRREMLAQELAEAEAEAAAAAAAAAAGGGIGDGDDMMVEGEGEEEDMDGGRDLDADIPDEDAAGMGFGYDGESDDEDISEEDEEEEEEEEEDDEVEEELSEEELERRREIARIRATEARMRQIREQSDYLQRHSDSIFDFDEEPVEEERSQMLEEDDLVRGDAYQQLGSQAPGPTQVSHDMDMDADLDDDIPVAESGGYEHTDSDASLNSDDDSRELSYARSSQVIHGRSSLRRSAGAPRSSLDISGLLSRDESSSIMGSSPHMRRGNY